jgi:hypothetical protein
MRYAKRAFGAVVTLTALLAGTATAYDCVYTPSLSANTNDYARCWFQNVSKKPLEVSISTSNTDCGTRTLVQDNGEAYCTGQVVSDNNAVYCKACSQTLSLTQLRKALMISFCIIPLGSNRCDGAFLMPPAKY